MKTFSNRTGPFLTLIVFLIRYLVEGERRVCIVVTFHIALSVQPHLLIIHIA